jgi:hypothetical protein
LQIRGRVFPGSSHYVAKEQAHNRINVWGNNNDSSHPVSARRWDCALARCCICDSPRAHNVAAPEWAKAETADLESKTIPLVVTNRQATGHATRHTKTGS